MTPEQFVQELLHSDIYDPAKAHDYYIRTRVLKGRHNGVAAKATSNGHGTVPSHPVHAPKPPTANQLRAQAAQKTEKLKERLQHLKEVLARLVAEAEKRSGVKKPEQHKTPHEKQQHHHQTEKEKQQKHRSYEKHKGEAGKHPTTDKELQSEIDKVKAEIRSIRAKIETSIQKARMKAAGH